MREKKQKSDISVIIKAKNQHETMGKRISSSDLETCEAGRDRSLSHNYSDFVMLLNVLIKGFSLFNIIFHLSWPNVPNFFKLKYEQIIVKLSVESKN